jgi:hypothetical protein
MYEMEGASPGPRRTRPTSCLAYLAPRAGRQGQTPAIGAGFPAPATFRGSPRAVPVSNGECISTASQGTAQGFAAK